jgi:single-strand DNA-binding protein
MSEQITVSGLVATDVKRHETADNLTMATFRLAANTRRFDAAKNSWTTTSTNWFTIVSFRQLAKNVLESVSKGDRVVIQGKLKIRDWDNGERSGTSIEIDADHIGLDLNFGISSFDRVVLRPDDEESEELEDELQPA